MSSIAAILPPLALALMWWVLTLRRQQVGLQWASKRGTFVLSFIGFEALLVAITELGSIGHHLTSGVTGLAWLAVVVAMGALLWGPTIGGGRLRDQLEVVSPRSIADHARNIPLVVALGVAAISVVILVLVVVGWRFVPNNTDSLVYHLPRVTHWAQQASVEHFATHYTAQLEFSPLHEFTMLHVHLLGGPDRLDGYVQLFALVVCIVGASEVARLLGATIEAQMGAALICAVIPSAVLQATSTQNDVFSAAIGIALFVVLLGWSPGGRWVGPAVALGLAAGLASIVKGGVPPLLAPSMVILAARAIWLERLAGSWRAALRTTAAAGAIVLVAVALLAGPHLKRNHDLFGTFTGPVSNSAVNEVFSARAAAGNVIRSVAVNFHIGDETGVDSLVQRAALDVARSAYDAVGASQADQRFVIGALSDAFLTGDYDVFARTEEYGANPWHVLLIGVTTILFGYWAVRGDRSARLPCLLAVGLGLGFVIFSATARWSLFVSRYQLPLLVVWAPLIAIALWRLHRYVLRAVLVGLVVAILPQLFDNASRSLIHPREDLPSDLAGYFVHPGGDGFFVAPGDYVAARDAIAASGCQRLGIGNWILLEYPIWIGLEHAGWSGEIEHIDVDNASSVLEDSSFEPCAVIRQTVGRPAGPQRPGWVEVPYGDLSVAFAPGVPIPPS